MRVARYFASGLINLVVTYLLYLLLIRVLAVPVSYTIAYVTGIGISYLLNRTFVFRARGGRRALLAFSGLYLMQYLLGLTITTLLLPWVGRELAPLGAVAVTVPLLYVMTRYVFAHL
jgi:putative flippase GtrA